MRVIQVTLRVEVGASRILEPAALPEAELDPLVLRSGVAEPDDVTEPTSLWVSSEAAGSVMPPKAFKVAELSEASWAAALVSARLVKPVG